MDAPTRRRIFTLLLIFAPVALMALLALGYSQTLRTQRVLAGARVLVAARPAYLKSGVLSTTNAPRPFLYTKPFVVAGTSHQSVLAVHLLGHENRGLLAITTDGTLLWVNRKERARVIQPERYQAKFFPPGM